MRWSTIFTFFAIEVLGMLASLWIACALNLAVAGLAYRMSLGAPAPAREPTDPDADPVRGEEELPGSWVLAAAAVVGFAFFVMELVWYRMLAPILGGSAYTFGLILAMALLGIGLGGLLYAMGSGERRPTVLTFAATLLPAFSQPFAVRMLDLERIQVRVRLAMQVDEGAACVDAFAPQEPWPVWRLTYLESRHDCYSKHHHRLTQQALVDLEAFTAMSSRRFGGDL